MLVGFLTFIALTLPQGSWAKTYNFVPRKGVYLSLKHCSVHGFKRNICVSNLVEHSDKKNLDAQLKEYRALNPGSFEYSGHCLKKDDPTEGALVRKVYTTMENVFNNAPKAMQVYLCSLSNLMVTHSALWNANVLQSKNSINVRKSVFERNQKNPNYDYTCLLYTSPSPRDTA